MSELCAHIQVEGTVNKKCNCPVDRQKFYKVKMRKDGSGFFLACQNYPNGCGATNVSSYVCTACYPDGNRPAGVGGGSSIVVTVNTGNNAKSDDDPFPVNSLLPDMCDCEGPRKRNLIVKLGKRGKFVSCQNYPGGCNSRSLSLYDGTDTAPKHAREAVPPPIYAQRILQSTMHLHTSAIFPPINHFNADPLMLNAPIETGVVSNNASSVSAKEDDEEEAGYWTTANMQKMEREGSAWCAALISDCRTEYEKTKLQPKNLTPVIFNKPLTLAERAAVIFLSRTLSDAGYELPTELRRGTYLEFQPYDLRNTTVRTVQHPEQPPHLDLLKVLPQSEKQCVMDWNDPISRDKLGFDFRFMKGDECIWRRVKIVPSWLDATHSAILAFQLIDSIPSTHGWVWGDCDYFMVCDSARPTPSSLGKWIFIHAASFKRAILRDLAMLESMPISLRKCHFKPINIQSITDAAIIATQQTSESASEKVMPKNPCPAQSAATCGTCAGAACKHLGVEGFMMEEADNANTASKWLDLFELTHATGGDRCDVYLTCAFDELVRLGSRFITNIV